MKDLIIFDLDGTLLDTLSDLRTSTNYALASEGLAERSLGEIRTFVGNGIRKLIERAVPADCPQDTLERVFSAFKAHYAENCMNTTAPYDGIPELLQTLKTAGYKLGVVSNKADAPVKALIGHYFPSVFDSVVGEREGVRRKPAPDAVFETVRALGSDIAGTLYIGDSDVDFQTAKNAGCDCVLVSWGFKSRAFLDSLGGTAVDSTQELLALIQKF